VVTLKVSEKTFAAWFTRWYSPDQQCQSTRGKHRKTSPSVHTAMTPKNRQSTWCYMAQLTTRFGRRHGMI